jgi:hypothetical protein
MNTLLKTGYKNEGYIYCIEPQIEIKGKKIVKIGKISMKIDESEIDIENKLATRYGTYYPDYELLYFERVNDCHVAEKTLFKLLKRIRHDREFFYKENDLLEKGFNKMKKLYPDINDFIKNLNETNLTKLNNIIRTI